VGGAKIKILSFLADIFRIKDEKPPVPAKKFKKIPQPRSQFVIGGRLAAVG
jgi:hypothetical protein